MRSTMTMVVTCLLGMMMVTTFFGGALAQKKAILGIDIGDAYMKVAMIQHGRLPDIVTNTASKRKTETAVGFDNSGHRLFAGDAANAMTRTTLQVCGRVVVVVGGGGGASCYCPCCCCCLCRLAVATLSVGVR